MLAVFSIIRKPIDGCLVSDPMESITKEVRMNRQQQARQKARLPTQKVSHQKAWDNARDGR